MEYWRTSQNVCDVAYTTCLGAFWEDLCSQIIMEAHLLRTESHERKDIEILPLKHTHTRFLIIIINNQTQQTSLCNIFEIVQFSSVTQSCLTHCDPMNRSMLGLPVHHQLPEFTQTHVHQVHDAILPSHPWSSPSLPAPNPSQHQSLFQWVNSSHEVAKALEFQL